MTSAIPISTQAVKHCLWYTVGVGLECLTGQGSSSAQLQLTTPSRMGGNTDQAPWQGHASPKAPGPMGKG